MKKTKPRIWYDEFIVPPNKQDVGIERYKQEVKRLTLENKKLKKLVDILLEREMR